MVYMIQSGFALNSERKRALEAGASAYLTKPIGGNQLIKVFEEFLLTKKN
jgi:CheY-like chemotaxis protein